MNTLIALRISRMVLDGETILWEDPNLEIFSTELKKLDSRIQSLKFAEYHHNFKMLFPYKTYQVKLECREKVEDDLFLQKTIHRASKDSNLFPRYIMFMISDQELMK